MKYVELLLGVGVMLTAHWMLPFILGILITCMAANRIYFKWGINEKRL